MTEKAHWERNPNGTSKTVQMTGYNATYSDGTNRLTGVQGKADPNMIRLGYQMVGYDVSTF